MRNAGANRRPRGRNNRGKGGNNRTQVYDSNGPDVRIRGTAHQIFEKYEALAKDALSSGDMVMAESYMQHAEHYQRIISTINEQQQQREAQNAQKQQPQKKVQDDNAGNKANSDDLGLPSSILGESVEVDAEPVRAMENA